MPIATERWTSAQIKEDGFWKRPGVYEPQVDRVLQRYAAPVQRVMQSLPQNPIVLDIASGPTCPSRLFEPSRRVCLDPLMVSYRETYGDAMPPAMLRLSGVAEHIPLPDATVDAAICSNALDHMITPETALAEIARVLKPGGQFVLAIFTHSPFISRLRRVVDKWLPMFREDAHPFHYTADDVRALVKGSFDLLWEERVFYKSEALIPDWHRSDWVFVCRPKGAAAVKRMAAGA